MSEIVLLQIGAWASTKHGFFMALGMMGAALFIAILFLLLMGLIAWWLRREAGNIVEGIMKRESPPKPNVTDFHGRKH